jgi:protein TonB
MALGADSTVASRIHFEMSAAIFRKGAPARRPLPTGFFAALLLHALLLLFLMKCHLPPKSHAISSGMENIVNCFIENVPEPSRAGNAALVTEPVIPIFPAAVSTSVTEKMIPQISSVTERPIYAPLPSKARSVTSAQKSSRQKSGTTTHAISPAGSGTSAKPRYRTNPAPDYPVEARRLRQQGVVLLEVEVSAEGRATGVRVLRSSGFSALDQAAMEAVRRWIFEPARNASLPVPSRVDLPVRFSISESN